MAKSFMGIDADYEKWARRQPVGARIAMLRTKIANANLMALCTGKSTEAIRAEAQAEIDRLTLLKAAGR